jgi:hypothetical protein
MTEQLQNKKLEHECFPQPADDSVRVWRYLDLAKFTWLLEKQKLYFTRVDLLNDLHEGSVPKFLAENHDQQILDLVDASILQKYGNDLGNKEYQAEKSRFAENLRQMRTHNQKERRLLYVNCWYLGNQESEAIWRLYCPGNNGVAIQTSYRKLVKSIENDAELYIGRVTYIDYELQGFPMGNFFYPVMHKRISFAHEQEVRLVKIQVPDNLGMQNEICYSGISIDWLVEPVIEAIYVDPYAPEYFFEAVSAIVRSIAPNLLGRVHWSKMRVLPIY